MEIILASASPRRQELLQQVGIAFRTVPSRVDERTETPMQPGQLVERLALAKARDVSHQHPEAVVIGADTLVVLNDRILGKPRDRDEAMEMLRQLSGQEHRVMTGVAVIGPGREAVSHEETTVRFMTVRPDQIERYVDSGEPMDKAGAYGIQGRAAAMIRSIEGDYFNVVGLPICRLVQMLAEFQIEVL